MGTLSHIHLPARLLCHLSRSLRLCLSSLVVLLHASSALAVQQPNGQTIPSSNDEVEPGLSAGEGKTDTIDAQEDALVSPETFQPTCTLTFRPLMKDGDHALAFGWYNATGSKPSDDELYAMITLPGGSQGVDDLNSQAVTLDLEEERAAGRYEGGEIGFWLVHGSGMGIHPEKKTLTGTKHKRYFTEHALNPGSTPTETYYQVLTWQSVTVDNAFYFGWEDQGASDASDNDFNDLLFQVTGIQCSGGGAACQTGNDGVCADGTLQCKKGELTCIQNAEPSEEKCNALDDDCNGKVDDNVTDCAADEVCHRGKCVPECGSGEFPCGSGLVCSDGVCVETRCADVECDAGKVCIQGECVDGCTGVTCPYGQTCRNGACYDPCDNLTCDDGYTCHLGVCESCECSGCGEGEVCSSANVCIEEACDTVTCSEGNHCVDGDCIDDCEGATCPTGQFCSAGECVEDPDYDPNQGAGGSGNGSGTGVIVDDDGPNAGGGAGESAGADGDGDGANGSCGCRLSDTGSASGAVAWLALLGALATMRRRRFSQLRVQ